jgi:hypothetical protein
MLRLFALAVTGLLSTVTRITAAQDPDARRDSVLAATLMLGGPSFRQDLGAGAAVGTPVGGPGSLCLADTGWVGPARLKKLREVAGSEQRYFPKLRTDLGNLARVDSARIAMVDSIACRRAAEGVAALLGWAKPSPLYLARAGPWYAAFPPAVALGEWGLAVYLNADMQPTGTTTW